MRPALNSSPKAPGSRYRITSRAAAIYLLISALTPPSLDAITLDIKSLNSSYTDTNIHVMFYGGTLDATYSGGAIQEKKDYTLAQLSGGVTINKYISGVVYLSLGKAMTESRASDPSPSDSGDADYLTRWDKCEITVNPNEYDSANLTGINLFSVPLQLERSKGGVISTDKKTYTVTGNEMFKRLGALTGQDATAVLKDATGKILRVLGPTQYAAGSSGPYPTFDEYVKTVKSSGKSIDIEDHYYGGGSTDETKAQDYKYTALVDKTTGDLKLTGGGGLVGYTHTVTIKSADIAYGIYSNNPEYTLDSNPAIRHVGDNDIYSAGVRDVLTGFAIGFVGSSVTDPVTGKAFQDEASKAWFAQSASAGGLAFSSATTAADYFNAYAELFYLYSGSYGFPFSDKLNKSPLLNIGSANADKLIITILSDGVTYQESVTNAISNASSPAAWRAGASSIISVPDSTGKQGLKYDSSNKLIVRTISKSSNFSSNYVGQAGYKIYGSATTDAAWVTTGKDLTSFYDNRGFNTTNTDLIKTLEQGLGMNDAGTHDAVIEYAVSADNDSLHRATKNPDITTYNPDQYGNDDAAYPFVQPAGMSTAAYNDFVAYYQQWRTKAYTMPYDASKSAPFTQLGYTYVWGYGSDLSSIQGMSEFIILGGTPVSINGIYSTASYIYSKNDGQYGNGYASFDISGACNTVWAGHRFQKLVSYSAGTPNHITIDKDVTVSGGQGILVWSLNYDVTNNGTITGTTANKFGIAGTNDIAVLFKGDTGTSYGTPVTEGGNKLTNSGSIDSPDTAVKSENGDTTIVNNTGATITGTTRGIWLMSGTNSITNSGTIDCGGTTAIQIDAGTTKLVNGGTINGNIVVGTDPTAALDVGNATVKLEQNGNYTQGAGATLKVTVDSAAVYGKIKTDSAANLHQDSKVYITTGNASIPNNSAFTVVDTSGNGVGNLPGTIGTNSSFFTFSGSTDTNDLVITATRTSTYTSLTSGSNTGAVASVLNTMAVNNTANGDMLTVLGQLDSMTSSQEINAAMESMTPSIDNSVPQATNASLDQFIGVSVSRLDNFQLSPSELTYSLEPKTPEIWAQGFGSYMHQDPMASSNGYNATVWGTALGFDLPVNKPFKVGASGGYAQDFIRTKDNSGHTNVSSYQCALYSTFGWPKFFIDVLPAFAYNTYDATRHVTVGTLDRVAEGNYGGQQYTGYVGCGYKIDFLNYLITPIASFQYTHLRINGYEETGAGALNLKVDPQNTDFAQTGFGTKLSRPFEIKGYTLIPELRFKWLYDWIGDSQQLTSTFTGGGAGFTTNGFTPAQSSYDFGAKLTLYTKGNVTLSINYDLELKEDFYGHNGYAEVRWAL